LGGRYSDFKKELNKLNSLVLEIEHEGCKKWMMK
jgi:hypothetical protein